MPYDLREAAESFWVIPTHLIRDINRPGDDLTARRPLRDITCFHSIFVTQLGFEVTQFSLFFCTNIITLGSIFAMSVESLIISSEEKRPDSKIFIHCREIADEVCPGTA